MKLPTRNLKKQKSTTYLLLQYLRSLSTAPKEIIGQILIGLTFICWSNLIYAQQPLSANAGKDSIICDWAQIDLIQIGGSPAAQGGAGNYQYEWEIYPKPFIPYAHSPNSQISANSILSNTRISNPYLTYLPENTDYPIQLILTVRDDTGAVARDTAMFYWTLWTKTTGNYVNEAFPGDTQSVSAMGFAGGALPYTFDWGDSDSILGGQYDFNVYPGNFPKREVIIPSSTPFPFYVLPILITDSLGCSIEIGTKPMFQIISVSVEGDLKLSSQVEIYPNPSKGSFFIKINPQEAKYIKLIDNNGRTIKEEKIELHHFNSIKWDTGILARGIYSILVEYDSGTVLKKIQIH